MKARLNIVEQVYHQCEGQPATLVEHRRGVWLTSDEQPYQRRTTVGEQWVKLDVGWVEQVGLLVILNHEPSWEKGNPTKEQKLVAEQAVVELGYSCGLAEIDEVVHAFALFFPGESGRFTPACATDLRIRCRKGEARVTVTVFPR